MHTARAPSNRVFLHKIKRKKRTVWMLKHLSTDGNQVSETIGKVGEMTKKDAMALQRKKQSDLDGGKIPRNRPQRMTLESFTSLYKERRRQGDTGRGYLRGSPRLTEATIDSHAMTLRYLVQHFGKDRLIESIILTDAERFVDALAAGELAGARTAKVRREWHLGEQSIRKNLRNAKAIFSWARRFGYVSANPFVDFDGKPLPSKPNHFVSQFDFEKLIGRLDREANCLERLIERADRMIVSACPGKQDAIQRRRRKLNERLSTARGWRTLFALCRLAGLRRGEAIALKWSGQAEDRRGEIHEVGVDLRERKIRLVAEKTRMYRVIPICPRLHQILSEAFDENAETVTGVTPHNLTRQGQVIVKAADMVPWPKLFQSMRSSCENDWKENGVAEPTFCSWLGHSPTVSRQSYTAPTATEFLSITSPEEAA